MLDARIDIWPSIEFEAAKPYSVNMTGTIVMKNMNIKRGIYVEMR